MKAGDPLAAVADHFNDTVVDWAGDVSNTIEDVAVGWMCWTGRWRGCSRVAVMMAMPITTSSVPLNAAIAGSVRTDPTAVPVVGGRDRRSTIAALRARGLVFGTLDLDSMDAVGQGRDRPRRRGPVRG